MRKVLIIAFHFPPLATSSGRLRALKFCRHLPDSGWLPVALTVHHRAYELMEPTQVGEIPPSVPVVRAFALDARKHLSFRGRYFRWLALPDRWISWCLGGVPAGLIAIYCRRIEVILSTFPIATAVLIGLILHRMTGKPWVVDVRDPMTEDGYPPDALTRRVLRWLEKQVIRHSSRLVFTTRSTMQMYLKRYPRLHPAKCLLIPNGYDEEDFQDLLPSESPRDHPDRRTRLLHLGLLDTDARNPTAFFRALARLKREGQVSAATLAVDLRASGEEDIYSRMLREVGIEDLVHLLPGLPYREALQDGARADGLLLFQAASCDHQIPAKAYEYLRLRKPILALTTTTGDTAAVLNDTGGATIADLADEGAIYRTMPNFLTALRRGEHPLPDERKVRQYSRSSQAQELAKCLSQLAGSKEESPPFSPGVC